MLNEVALILAALVALWLITTAWVDRSRGNKYMRLAHTERTRSVWAEAREELFNLVRDEKLDPRSKTFDVLFGIQTFIVRRPDAYQEIASQLQDSLIASDTAEKPSWMAEQATWPAEMRSVLSKMAKGSEMLAFGYPGLFGKLLRLTGSRTPAVAATLVRAFLGNFRLLAEHSKGFLVERELFQARDQLQYLSDRKGSGGYDLMPA